MSNYKYRFSIIVPIYNVEKYLEESIQSIINQTIGFKRNIQLILVNDGSKDNSEDICLKYKQKYPENIVYIKQQNCGVSSARNKGMQYIEGKYVNFLDSDDKWELDAFKKVWKFFEKNHEKIDIVACRLKYFGMKDKYHYHDYKFEDGDRIIDIYENYDMIQCHMAPCFFKATEIKDLKFDEDLRYSEDALFVGKVVLEKGKIGFLRSVEYKYRKRDDFSSALDNSKQNKNWYNDSVLYYKKLIKESIDRVGKVIPYIQFQIMYDFQWKVKMDIRKIDIFKVLSKEEQLKHISDVKEVLGYIDDNIIAEQKNIYAEHKVLILKLKYNKDVCKELEMDKGKIYYNGTYITRVRNNAFFRIAIMEVKDNNLILEGEVTTILPKEDYNIFLCVKGQEKQKVELKPFTLNEELSLYGELLHIQRFKIELPINESMKFRFILEYKNENKVKIKCSFGKFAKLNKLDSSYCKTDKFLITKNKDIISIKDNKFSKAIKREIKYDIELLKLREFKVIIYRLLYKLFSVFVKRPIWILSDRIHRANDNGMHLFKYIQTKEKNAKVYFMIDKHSEDYKKMKKIGKVLKYNSLKYKLYFLLSSKIISSQADDWVINAFFDKQKYLKDLYKFDFIFLQHGITKDNISGWLNKFKKNIKIFVTAAIEEYKSISNGEDYLYTENEVKLLGFPRYDNLKNDSKNKIVFMPTWRMNIVNTLNTQSASPIRGYSSEFKKTEYFKFYNKLINDERIIKALKEAEFTAKFCIHPSFEEQYIDFDENEVVEISPKIADYQKEFSESNLLITDFSSVAFDFAYLRKPVIYTQFDADTFYEGHLYNKGYFDYKEDGFGPVCYDYETSVNAIIKSIQNNCKQDEEYLQRINKFYKYNDKNNCKRVYEEILKL